MQGSTVVPGYMGRAGPEKKSHIERMGRKSLIQREKTMDSINSGRNLLSHIEKIPYMVVPYREVRLQYLSCPDASYTRTLDFLDRYSYWTDLGYPNVQLC